MNLNELPGVSSEGVGEASPKKLGESPQWDRSSEVSLDADFFDDNNKENRLDNEILQTFSEEQLRFILSLKDKRNWTPRVQRELKKRIINPVTDEPFKGKKSSKQEKSKQGEKEKLYKPGPRDIGRNKNWKPAKYDKFSKAEKKQKKSRSASSETAGATPSGGKKVYKPGPRDIGRNNDWKPANYGIDLKKMQEEDFLRPRIKGKRSSPRKGKGVEVEEVPNGSKFKVYKQGPRDIGRMKGWKAANYGIDLKKAQEEDFLKPRTSGKTKVEKRKTQDAEVDEVPNGSKFKVYKQGPRDIGRMKGWKAANYGIDLKKMQEEDFLRPRIKNKRSSPRKGKDVEVEEVPNGSKFKVYKQGPRDIGRMKGWKPAKYDIKQDDSNFLKPRIATSKKITGDAPYKPGPRDIGRNKKYKAAEYDIKKDDKEFLSERVRTVKSEGEVPAKLGPVEIGRQKDFQPPEYEIKNDDKEFLSPRVASVNSDNDEEVAPKLGPIEIGRNTDYVPAKYDVTYNTSLSTPL